MVRHDWSAVRRKAFVAPLVGVVALGTAVLASAAPPSGAAEPAQQGAGAYGFFAGVALFGGPQKDAGPTPTVTLPPEGSGTPITDSAAEGMGGFGPAVIFSSGQLDVSVQGTAGSVTASATVKNTNQGGTEVFTATSIAATCTGGAGSTVVTGGKLILVDPDPDKSGEPGEVVQEIPANPPPNTEYSGKIPPPVGDSFRYVFNEQTVGADGGITVNAGHQFLRGPNAFGDLIVGQARCSTGSTAPTTVPPETPAAPVGGGGTTGGSATAGPSTGGGTGGIPTTGTDVTPLIFIGLELVGAGALAVFWAKRRRVWPLR